MFTKSTARFILILACLIATPLLAGGEHEIEKVEELINSLNQNILDQNTAEVDKRIHATFQMVESSKGEMNLLSRSTFLKRIEQKDMGGVSTEVRLKNIDISGGVGTITALLVSKEERTRAYYSLIRTDSGWLVLNLTMDRKPNPEFQGESRN